MQDQYTNPDGYNQTSVLGRVSGLNGHYLLVHGTGNYESKKKLYGSQLTTTCIS